MTPNEGANQETAGPTARLSEAFPGLIGRAVPSFVARDTADVYQTVAWRAPTPTRFDGRPANDFLIRAEAIAPRPVWRAQRRALESLPAGWLTVVIGAAMAALLGALVGGLMSV